LGDGGGNCPGGYCPRPRYYDIMQCKEMFLFYWMKYPDLDINVCPIPVKTDVRQVDLVSWLSDGTSEKMTVLPFEGYFL
jgi:hypothetical protein